MKRIDLSFILILLLGFACSAPSSETAVNKNLKTVSFKDVAETKAYFNWKKTAPRLVSAHRGGPYPGYPENSIEAFENVLKYTPAIIECDIAVTKDQQLVMMHDDKLDRTTTGKGFVKDFTLKEIKELYLKDAKGTITAFKVPTLKEVLQWTKGKAFLTLDIKRGVSYDQVNQLIKETDAEPYVAVITYTIGAAQKFHSINPDLMISITARNLEEVGRIKQSGIKMENLIAFTGISEPKPEVYAALHELKIFTILGALGNLDRRALSRGNQFYLELFENGADIIATDRPLEVQKELEKP